MPLDSHTLENQLSPFCYAWFQANLNTISRQNTHHFKRVQTETQAALMRKTTNKSNKALKANKLLNCKNAYMFAPMEQLPCWSERATSRCHYNALYSAPGSTCCQDCKNQELKVFFTNQKDVKLLSRDQWCTRLLYLADIFEHLIDLNTQI